jgi:pimeloyl-ACP methyl ester carboxylesterase
MALVVLVHGAFGTPQELAPVEPILAHAGHDVAIVDLPCTDPQSSLSDYAESVISALGPPQEDPATLVVGHSFGGATIGLVREKRPDVTLAYVAALVPQPGQSLVELLLEADPFEDPEITDPLRAFDSLVVDAGSGLVVDAGPGLCRVDIDVLSASVPEEERAEFRQMLLATQRDQGIAAMRERWPGASVPSGRTSYVVATSDTMVDPEIQRTMAAELGAAVYEVDSDHEVFLEHPEELGAILAELASALPRSN